MCNHKRRVGDNYGVSCMDCGERLSGFGYGGWFGQNLKGTEFTCIHVFVPMGDEDAENQVCLYCETLKA